MIKSNSIYNFREYNRNLKDQILSKAFENRYDILIYFEQLKKSKVIDQVSISKSGFSINYLDINLLIDLENKFDIAKQLLFLGEYENYFLDFLNKFKNDYSVFIDIGANVGLHTLVFAKKKENKVFSFEPAIKNYNMLNKNLEINSFQNVKVFNYALMENNKNRLLYYDNVNPAASSFEKLFEEHSSNTESVTSKTLDSLKFINDLEKIDFIKIDTEGSELFVIKGALKTIHKFKPLIFVEMLRKWSKKFNYHPNDIINLLKDSGYEVFTFSEKGIKKIDFVDEKTEETNFLFKHSSSKLNINEYI